MKRLLSLALIFVMFFSMSVITYAEDSVLNEIDPNKEIELGLEQAIDYALKHSRDVKIQDLEMKRAQLQYDLGRNDIRNLESLIEEFEAESVEKKQQNRVIMGADYGVPVIEESLLGINQGDGSCGMENKKTPYISVFFWG